SPKIVSKVNSISNNRIKRSSLTKYKDQLLKEFKDEEVLDFYSGNVLKSNDISVDHVIPWSYMYSDDIWNLVLTSKSNNSRKSNTVPSEEIINKLKERNKNIENLLDDTFKNEMLNSINNNLVDKFYYDLRHN
nr:HNH endonuclease [Clostridia bacterium]